MKKILSLIIAVLSFVAQLNAQSTVTKQASIANLSQESLQKLLYNRWNLKWATVENKKMDASEDNDYMIFTKDYIESGSRRRKTPEIGSYRLNFKNKTILVDLEEGNVSKMKILSISSSELRIEFKDDEMPMVFIFQRG